MPRDRSLQTLLVRMKPGTPGRGSDRATWIGPRNFAPRTIAPDTAGGWKPMKPDPEICYLSAVEARERFRARTLSPGGAGLEPGLPNRGGRAAGKCAHPHFLRTCARRGPHRRVALLRSRTASTPAGGSADRHQGLSRRPRRSHPPSDRDCTKTTAPPRASPTSIACCARARSCSVAAPRPSSRFSVSPIPTSGG